MSFARFSIRRAESTARQPSELSRAAWAILNAPAGQVSEQQRKSLLRAGRERGRRDEAALSRRPPVHSRRELSQRREAVGEDLRGEPNCPSFSRRPGSDRGASWTTNCVAWARRWSGRSESSWNALSRGNGCAAPSSSTSRSRTTPCSPITMSTWPITSTRPGTVGADQRPRLEVPRQGRGVRRVGEAGRSGPGRSPVRRGCPAGFRRRHRGPGRRSRLDDPG